jgi:hypothetical protein
VSFILFTLSSGHLLIRSTSLMLWDKKLTSVIYATDVSFRWATGPGR